MEWYNYIAAFFSGAFLANAVPHFIHGISGDKFPTPFARPPGKGLSSSTTNVIWALFNIVAGYPGCISRSHPVSVMICFAGAAVMSVMLSVNFQKKDVE